jgi:hypothetical protein
MLNTIVAFGGVVVLAIIGYIVAINDTPERRARADKARRARSE